MRWEEQRRTMQEEAQRQAQLSQYNDELARKRQQSEHELQRSRNQELVAMQEQAAARKEAERLRIEQQIQAERRAADQHAVSACWQHSWPLAVDMMCDASTCNRYKSMCQVSPCVSPQCCMSVM